MIELSKSEVEAIIDTINKKDLAKIDADALSKSAKQLID